MVAYRWLVELEAAGDRPEIAEDVREEFWSDVRKEPDKKAEAVIRCLGKYSSR